MIEWFKNVFRNCSKQQFIRRLHQRSGHPFFLSFDPAFIFETETDKWKSLEQLEALVEFYMNYQGPAPQNLRGDPWLHNAQPLKPNDDGYMPIDFRQPNGSSAQILGGSESNVGNNNIRIIQLDGEPNLRMILPNPQNNPLEPTFQSNVVNGYPAPCKYLYDTLWIENDTGRPNKLYRIMSVDAENFTVTLDAAPQFNGKSAWRINTRPILVLIDAFGPRERGGNILRGQNAVLALGPDGSPRYDANGNTILSLDGGPDLSRINDGFDTIYLGGDTVKNRGLPFRTYRIIDHDDVADTITIAGNPIFDGANSIWHIPAGVSGEMTSLNYNLGPGGGKGYDHYDGMIFLIYGGKIINRFRWTSFTSRNWPVGQNLSSIRGNKCYFFSSYRSGGEFKNYSFKVVDVNISDSGIQPAPFDGVCEARYYFQTAVNADGQITINDDSVPAPRWPAPGGATPITNAPLGKQLIRIHDGSQFTQASGTGSAGCNVSPLINRTNLGLGLRDQIIENYQIEFDEFYGPNSQDHELQKAFNRDRAQIHTLWNNSNTLNIPAANKLIADNWNSKLVGLFWVIRPDELPES